MNESVFLSHNRNDKDFVRRIAIDLENHGIKCWLDEAEMKVGDSLIDKITEAINKTQYFAIFLSPNSINSDWVTKELEIALRKRIANKKVTILPLILKECPIPASLSNTKCCLFKSEDQYESSFRELVSTFDVVFNKSTLRTTPTTRNLGTSTDKSTSFNLPILSKPFHRPFQYIGMTLQNAEDVTGGERNSAGNIIIDSEECRMLLEAEGNYVQYIEVDLLATVPHNQESSFDSEVMLGSLSISLSELELIRTQTHYHTYYDHRRKLKIGVSCSYDQGPISIGFSSKYYGQ